MCQQKENYRSPIGILLLLQLSSYKLQWWGKIECGAMHECESTVRCLACFGNLPIEGHSRIKINTQILDRWLKLDGWTGNWNECNGFSQGFKRFGPWVEKSNVGRSPSIASVRAPDSGFLEHSGRSVLPDLMIFQSVNNNTLYQSYYAIELQTPVGHAWMHPRPGLYDSWITS